jgi:site-specific recombinase XerD
VRTRGATERFRSLLAAHVEDLEARRLSLTARTQAQRVLPALFLHLREEGVADPQGVAEEHLVRFVRHLAAQGLAAATQAAYVGAVKRFFAFLKTRGLLLTDPARDLTLPTSQRLPRPVLSESQAERLVAAPAAGSTLGKRDGAILETLYGTGIRRSECLRADVMDVDLAEGVLLVRDGKGRKDRFVPVLGRAAAALDVYLAAARPELVKHAAEAALFLSSLGRRLSKAGLALIVARHAKAAGVRAHPHALRHACATHLLRGGAGVRHVQELLGHRSLATTQLYTRVGVEDLRGVMMRTHPRERSWRERGER